MAQLLLEWMDPLPLKPVVAAALPVPPVAAIHFKGWCHSREIRHGTRKDALDAIA